MNEIKLYGRGGQGMVMASEMLVHAALLDGLYGISIPQFGFERRGSPVTSSVRIDDKPIREKTQVYSPGCVVVGDQTLLGSINVFSGIQDGAILVLNSTRDVETLHLPPQVKRLGLLDATKIALEVLGIPVTNTTMVGAFAKTTGWVRVNSALEGIRNVMPPKVAEKNIEAARRASQEVRIFELERKELDETSIVNDVMASGTVAKTAKPKMKLKEEAVGPCGTDLYIVNTGDWRVLRPVIDSERCQCCGQCWLICPTGCVDIKSSPVSIDYRYCKGCGLCAQECGFGAIQMERELRG